jgi:crotonobetainyl-CoA:carnitine CoA-transferase CaiB-like acyl-CoA transferase
MGMLEGIRVLELGGGVSAPFCGKLLADYGADVIKIETPLGGDPSRHAGPFVNNDPHPEKSIPFLYLNTNKRGITLDIFSSAGRAILDSLMSTSDIVVQNMAVHEIEALSLTSRNLEAINPRLIITSITPFGLSGPYKNFESTDIVTYALSGLMYHSGDSDREPLRNVLNQSFYVSGINAAVATTAALFQRLVTGVGQEVEVSVIECLASHLVQPVPYYEYMGAIKGRRPIRGSGFDELMPARDGYVVPSIQGSQPWSVIADLIGPLELQDERFGTGSGRIEYGEEIKALLIEGLASWDRKPLFEASGEKRLVFGMAQDAGDLYDCRHLENREFLINVDHPIAGLAKYPGMGPKISENDSGITKSAPLLGEHNRELFQKSLGYSSEDIVDLYAVGVI